MATSATMQSVLARPVTSVTTRARFSQFTPCSYVPYLQKDARMQVRCMAKYGQKEDVTPKPKVSTKFSDVLAFSGPAPERINGRLAMIGFVAAMAVELSNGEDVLVQISNGGVPWFVGTSIVLTLASLVPLFKGVSVESRSERIMSSDAELWNGRFAMLGLVALAFTEFVKGGALV
ncbi:hypothetical protein CsSME_00020853 [Camellia sinensis var. sinensis]